MQYFSLKRFTINLSGVCDKGQFLSITSNVKILMREESGIWQRLSASTGDGLNDLVAFATEK